MVGVYIRYGVNQGKNTMLSEGEIDKIFCDIIRNAVSNVRYYPELNNVLDWVMDDYKNSMKEDLFSMGHKEFGEIYGKKFRNQDYAEKWIDNLSLKHMVDFDALGCYDVGSFVDMVSRVGKENEVLVELYKKSVFPVWFKFWKSQGIVTTRKTIDNIYKKLQAVNSSNMGNAMAVINIALNASHQTGDMLDYISEHTSTSLYGEKFKSFLDEMSGGYKVEEWNKELREIGIEI